MECIRPGCENILCKYMVYNQYLCTECVNKFISAFPKDKTFFENYIQKRLDEFVHCDGDFDKGSHAYTTVDVYIKDVVKRFQKQAKDIDTIENYNEILCNIAGRSGDMQTVKEFMDECRIYE